MTRRSAGIGPEEYPEIVRAIYDQCCADAAHDADPSRDLTGYLDALYRHLDVALDLSRRGNRSPAEHAKRRD